MKIFRQPAASEQRGPVWICVAGGMRLAANASLERLLRELSVQPLPIRS